MEISWNFVSPEMWEPWIVHFFSIKSECEWDSAYRFRHVLSCKVSVERESLMEQMVHEVLPYCYNNPEFNVKIA